MERGRERGRAGDIKARHDTVSIPAHILTDAFGGNEWAEAGGRTLWVDPAVFNTGCVSCNTVCNTVCVSSNTVYDTVCVSCNTEYNTVYVSCDIP